METSDYYSDRKFCPQCNAYQAYLMSVAKSYCTECGGEVRLFSKDDWQQFHAELATKKPSGGRPRKDRGARSA